MSGNEIHYEWDLTKEDFSLELDFFNEKEQEDKLWQARTELDYDTLSGAIETIIFMQDRPITIQKIKNLIDSEIPLRVIHESLVRLQKEYEQKHHGIRLQEVADGYQFRTKATYSRFVQKMFSINALSLSPTALEVLAIIAYKGPISKNGVEKIRGVDSSHIIRSLMDKRLVSMQGRSEEVGRPSLFGTTNEFLEVFNLNSLNDLPAEHELEEMATASHAHKIADIKNVVQNGEKDRFVFDEISELDELSSVIKEISSDTEFIKELKQEDRLSQKDQDHVRKSAFDILEEFVSVDQTLRQNQEAANSETLTQGPEAKVVTPQELENLLNAPEVDEELFLEAESLEAALAEAHDDLFKDNSEDLDFDDTELEELTENATLQAEKLQGVASEVSQKAKDLDIDLNFLPEDLDSNS